MHASSSSRQQRGSTPAKHDGHRTPAHQQGGLQQSIGNQATLQLLSQPSARSVQPKLVVGRPDDPLEREADVAADKVMRMPDATPAPNPDPARAKRGAAAEGGIQTPASSPEAPQSQGEPLDKATRDFFEPRFGHDFGNVRVHADGHAAASADSIGALAYTAGSNIAFGPGQYQPLSRSGQALLAHELAHVAQQSAGVGFPQTIRRQAGAASEPTPLEDQATRPASKSIILALQEVIPGASGGTGNFPKAFHILDSLAMFDMLDTLDELRRLGEFDLLQEHVGEAEGVGISRIRVALAAVHEHGNVTPDGFAATQGDAFSSLPADQQTDLRNFLAKAATPSAVPPSQGPAQTSIVSMSGTDKLIAAYERANIGAALRSQLAQRFSAKQLVLMIAAGIGVFIAAQFTPVGWIADIGMVLTAAFVGKALFDAFHHLAGFAAAVDARTDDQLQQAADEFAAAVAGMELDTIFLLLTLLSGGAAGTAGKAAASASAPAEELVLLGANGIRLGTIPAATAAETATAITTAQAAALGLKGTALANAMASTGGGTTGFSRAAPKIPQGDAKQGWAHIEARHVTGTDPGGDLFAAGTTRAELEEAAGDVVDKGLRVSDPKRTVQVFERRIVVHGRRDLVRVVVNSSDNTVITMFPVISGP